MEGFSEEYDFNPCRYSDLVGVGGDGSEGLGELRTYDLNNRTHEKQKGKVVE